jgi:hypothetical protein
LKGNRYHELGVDPVALRITYRTHFHNLLDDELLVKIRKSSNAYGLIGDKPFKEQIESRSGCADR